MHTSWPVLRGTVNGVTGPMMLSLQMPRTPYILQRCFPPFQPSATLGFLFGDGRLRSRSAARRRKRRGGRDARDAGGGMPPVGEEQERCLALQRPAAPPEPAAPAAPAVPAPPGARPVPPSGGFMLGLTPG
jgi:hypothetical protein